MNQNQFINDKMKLSPYNYSEAVRKNLNIPKKITLCEATLREGAQGSIVGFSAEEKIQILQKAYDAGIRYFQIGTSREKEDLEAIMAYVKENNLEITTEVLFADASQDFRPGIDYLLNLGIDVLDIMGFFTEYGLVTTGGADKADMIMQFEAAQIQYIAAKGGKVSFDPMDAPRMEMDIMMRAYRNAVQAGANQIRILDTVGTGSPATWRYLINTIKAEFPEVEICVHCHNDFGQAMANVYTSIECGVDMIDVTINGLGERCGNPHLAQVAAGAELMYGVDTGIDLSKMTELSQFVGEIANHQVDRNTPITGNWAFAHGDEGHYRILAVSPWAFEGIHADVFGNHQDTLLGPMAGPVSTRTKLASLGYTDLSNEEVLEAYKIISSETQTKKHVLSDDELCAIVNSML